MEVSRQLRYQWFSSGTWPGFDQLQNVIRKLRTHAKFGYDGDQGPSVGKAWAVPIIATAYFMLYLCFWIQKVQKTVLSLAQCVVTILLTQIGHYEVTARRVFWG